MAETTKIYVNSSWTESTVFEGDYAGLEWGKTAFADFATATAAASAGAEIIAVGDVTGADSVRLTGGAYSITGQDGASIYMDGNLHLQYESSDKKSLKDYSDFAPLTLTINTDLSANYLQVGPLNDTDELDCEADQVSGILESLRKNTAAVIVDGADVDARTAINIYSYATAEFKNGAHLDAGNLCVRGEATFTGSTFNVGDQGQSLSVYMKPEFYTEGYSAAELTLNNSIGEATRVTAGTSDRAGIINLTNGSKLTSVTDAVSVAAAGTIKIDTNSTLVYTTGISLTNTLDTDKAIQITADYSKADSGILVWVDGTAVAGAASIKDYVTINVTNGDGWTVADGSNGSVYAYNAEKVAQMPGVYVGAEVAEGGLIAGANGYYIGGVNTYTSFADAAAAGQTVIEFNDYNQGITVSSDVTLSGTVNVGWSNINAVKGATITIAKDTEFTITAGNSNGVIVGIGGDKAGQTPGNIMVDGTMTVIGADFNIQSVGTVTVSATGKLDLSKASTTSESQYSPIAGNLIVNGDGTFEKASLLAHNLYFFKDHTYTAEEEAIDYANLIVKDALIQTAGHTVLDYTAGVNAWNKSQINSMEIKLDNSKWMSEDSIINLGSKNGIADDVKGKGASNAYIDLKNGSLLDTTGSIYIGEDEEYSFLAAEGAEAGKFTTENTITIDSTSTLKYDKGLYIYANNAAVAGSEGAEGVAYKGGSIVINADAAKIADQDIVFWVDGRKSETGINVLLNDNSDITSAALNDAIEIKGEDALTKAGWQIVNDGKNVYGINTNNIDMNTITVNADWAGKYSTGDTIEGYDGLYFGINAVGTIDEAKKITGDAGNILVTGDIDGAEAGTLTVTGQNITFSGATVNLYQVGVGTNVPGWSATWNTPDFGGTLALTNGSVLTVANRLTFCQGTEIIIDTNSTLIQETGVFAAIVKTNPTSITINADVNEFAEGTYYHSWISIANSGRNFKEPNGTDYSSQDSKVADLFTVNVANNEDGRWKVVENITTLGSYVFTYDTKNISTAEMYVKAGAWTDKATSDGVFTDPAAGDVNLLKDVNAFDTVSDAVNFAKISGGETKVKYYDAASDSYLTVGTDIQTSTMLVKADGGADGTVVEADTDGDGTAEKFMMGVNAYTGLKGVLTGLIDSKTTVVFTGDDSTVSTMTVAAGQKLTFTNASAADNVTVAMTYKKDMSSQQATNISGELTVGEGVTFETPVVLVVNGTLNVDGAVKWNNGGEKGFNAGDKAVINISATGSFDSTGAYNNQNNMGATFNVSGTKENFDKLVNGDAGVYQLKLGGSGYSNYVLAKGSGQSAEINVSNYGAVSLGQYGLGRNETNTVDITVNNGYLTASNLSTNFVNKDCQGTGVANIKVENNGVMSVNELILNSSSSLTIDYSSKLNYTGKIDVAGKVEIDMTGADGSEAFIKVVDATNNKGKFTGTVTVIGQAQAPVVTFSAENVADGTGLVDADEVYGAYVQAATGDVFAYAKADLDLYGLYSLNKTDSVAGYTLTGAIGAVNVSATQAVTMDAGAVITYSGAWRATEGVNITITGTLENPHKLIDYTGTGDAPAAYDNVIVDPETGLEAKVIGGDLYLVAKPESGESGPEFNTDKTTIVADGLRGDDDPVLYNGAYWVKDFNMFDSVSAALNGADDTTEEFVLANLDFTESSLKDLMAATEGKTLTADGGITVTGYTKINEWSALLDGADLKGTAGNDTLAISAKGTKMKVDGEWQIWGEDLEAGVSAELNYGDMSIDLRGGNNKVTVGSGSVLSLKALKNVSGVTVSKDKAEKVGKETVTADTALNLAEDLVTGEGTVAVAIQDGAEMTAANITKADVGMGVNNITLGKASTLTLTGTGAGMEYVQNLTLGDNAVVSGAEKVLTGTDTANTVVKTGVGASLTLGAMNLGEGKNSVTTGNNSELTVDSMTDVTTLKIGSGTFDKKAGVQNVATAAIGSLAMSAGVTEITLGSYAQMDVNTLTNGNNGSKITVGANSYLGIGEEAKVTITALSLTAGSNKADSDFTMMEAAKTAIVGTVAKNTIKVGNNAELILGSIDLKGGKNSIDLGGKNVDFTSGEIKNVQTFKIGAGKAEKDGSYLADNYSRAEVDGNFTGVAGANTIDLGTGADMEITGSILESDLGGSYAVKLGTDATLDVQEIEALSSLNLGANAELKATAVTGTDSAKTGVTVGKNAVLEVETLALGEGKNTVALSGAGAMMTADSISGINALDVKAGALLTTGSLSGTELTNDKMTVSGDLYLTDLDIAGIENFTLNKGGKIFASEDVLGALGERDIFTDKGGQLIEFDGIGDDLVNGEGWLRGGVDDKDTVKLSDAKELTVNGNFADVLSVSGDNGVIEGTYDKKTKITTWKLEGLTSVSVEFAGDAAQDKKGYVTYIIA